MSTDNGAVDFWMLIHYLVKELKKIIISKFEVSIKSLTPLLKLHIKKANIKVEIFS